MGENYCPARKGGSLLLRAVFLLTICGTSWSAGAQTTRTWNGSAGTNWSAPANWTPAGVPGAADHVVFPAVAVQPVLSAATTVADIRVNGGSVDLAGHTLTFTGNGTFSSGEVLNGALRANSALGTISFNGTSFTANVEGQCYGVVFSGSVFHAPVSLVKTGSSHNVGTGGGTFHAPLELTLNAGRVYMAHYSADQFHADLTVNSNAGSSGLWVGQSSGSMSFTTGAHLRIGALGFSTGYLQLRNISLNTLGVHALALTGDSRLYMEHVAFQGPAVLEAPFVSLSGSTFHGDLQLIKTGSNTESGTGGSVFHGTVDLLNTGTAALIMAQRNKDIFHADVRVASSGTGGIRFGSGDGGGAIYGPSAHLSVGANGFAVGLLEFGRTHYSNTAAITLGLGVNAFFRSSDSTVWGAPISVEAGRIMLEGSTFEGDASFRKTHAISDQGAGGCIFRADLELALVSAGLFTLAHTKADVYEGNVRVSNLATGTICLGSDATGTRMSGGALSIGSGGFAAGSLELRSFRQEGAVAQQLLLGSDANIRLRGSCYFEGELDITAGLPSLLGGEFQRSVAVNKTGSATLAWSGGSIFRAGLAIDLSGGGSLRISESADDSIFGELALHIPQNASLNTGNASGRTILTEGGSLQLGTTTFEGRLTLRNFEQNGNMPQGINGGPAAFVLFETGTRFDGALTCTAGRILTRGATYNGPLVLVKTGAISESSSGGNTFNSSVEYVLRSDAAWGFAQTTTDTYAEDLLVSSTASGTIGIGSSGYSGSSIFTPGKNIRIGALGFDTGSLHLTGVELPAGDPLDLELGTTAFVRLYERNVFARDVSIKAGRLYLNGSTFQGNTRLMKTGPGTDASTGGNHFQGPTDFHNLNVGNFTIANTGHDLFESSVTVNNHSSGSLRFGGSGSGTSVTIRPGGGLAPGPVGLVDGMLILRAVRVEDPRPIVLPAGASVLVQLLDSCMFTGAIEVRAGRIEMNTSQFHGDAHFIKTGTVSDVSRGGNVFHGRTTFTLLGGGTTNLQDQYADIFHGDVELNSTDSRIVFGRSGGTHVSRLMSGARLLVGPMGFSNADLIIRHFHQEGPTPQTLVLAPTSRVLLQAGTRFDAELHLSAGGLVLVDARLLGPTTLVKTGDVQDISTGRNYFGDRLVLTNAGNGRMLMGEYAGDSYQGDVVFESLGTGTIRLQGGVADPSTLAAGRTLSIGPAGFATGDLRFRRFRQLGNVAQELLLGTEAGLMIQDSTEFEGPLTCVAGWIQTNNATYHRHTRFSNTGVVNNTSSGGNLYHGTVEYHLLSTAYWSHSSTRGDSYNGDVVLSNSGGGELLFGSSSGSSRMEAGGTIRVGPLGFEQGGLTLRNFEQLGTEPIALLLGAHTRVLLNGCTVGGALDLRAAKVQVILSSFASNVRLTKTASDNDISTGGNNFHGDLDVYNQGSGRFDLAYSTEDRIGGDLRLSNASTGMIAFGRSSGGATILNGALGVGDGGFDAGTLYLRRIRQQADMPNMLELGQAAELHLLLDSDFRGPMVARAGNLYLQGSTYQGTFHGTKSGHTANASQGGNQFRDLATFLATGNGVHTLSYSAADTYGAGIRVGSTASGGLHIGRIATAAPQCHGAIGLAPEGFTSGSLTLGYFAQLGAQMSSLPMNGASFTATTGTAFRGPLEVTATTIVLSGATFRDEVFLRRTGSATSSSSGGNTFHGKTRVESTGTWNWATGTQDRYLSDLELHCASGTLTMCYAADCQFGGNVTLTGDGVVRFGISTARAIFMGGSDQHFRSYLAGDLNMRHLVLSKTAGELLLHSDLNLSASLTLTNGVLRTMAPTSTSTGLLIMQNGSTVSNSAHADSYVAGFLRKVGNRAFEFPVGDAGVAAPIEISAPSGTTSHFTARYTHSDPGVLYDPAQRDPELTRLSRCSYWDLDRTSGSAAVSVTIPFDNVLSCGVVDPTQLVIARWNGTKWRNHGNGGLTGNGTSGTVRTSGTVSSFSPFALGSLEPVNPLPIELLSFHAEPVGDASVHAFWSTASERNNAYFELQRSADALDFHTIGIVEGAGNSMEQRHYRSEDDAPLEGSSYYRLRQVDTDGTATYSSVVVVDRNGLGSVRAWPNPAIGPITLALPGTTVLRAIRAFDSTGRLLLVQSMPGASGHVGIDVSVLPAGIHVLVLEMEDGRTEQLRIQKL